MAGINLGIGLSEYRVALGVDITNPVLGFLEVVKSKAPGMVTPEDVTLAATGEVGRGIKGTETPCKLGIKQGRL